MTEMTDTGSVEQRFAQHEHREIKAGLAAFGAAAAGVGSAGPDAAGEMIVRASHWVQNVLLPHAEWEDRVLYAEIDEKAATPWATRLMRFEHRQIARLAARLELDADRVRKGLTHDSACEIRADISGLDSLIRAHVEREELFLLPMLSE